ncbi:hypothetical protein [Companilactobacillus mishanensis]|uniref:Uncharacterized protein n=1 Tax=Companilactobacillus mishanensis TaxID=2486008 RepID=A0A5P0ZGK7_9LACO|nr:hypothetical protein [Companilactobacillus mishanensis]MQS52181.1 hypothetical protein [Companilactobacillus mishanensis]
MKHIRVNRFWVISGLETFILGLLFALENNFIDQPPHMPKFVSLVDNPPFAIMLMIVGFYVCMTACTHYFSQSTRSVVTFILLFIWTFYFIIFLIHDVTGPFLIPRYTTVITGFIVLRVMSEAMWSKKS